MKYIILAVLLTSIIWMSYFTMVLEDQRQECINVINRVINITKRINDVDRKYYKGVTVSLTEEKDFYEEKYAECFNEKEEIKANFLNYQKRYSNYRPPYKWEIALKAVSNKCKNITKYKCHYCSLMAKDKLEKLGYNFDTVVGYSYDGKIYQKHEWGILHLPIESIWGVYIPPDTYEKNYTL